MNRLELALNKKWPMPNMPLIDLENNAILNVLKRGINYNH